MDWHAHIEAVFAREQAAGRMTHHEVKVLHHRLNMLAFNMTVADQSGEMPRAVAAFWMLHRQRERSGRYPKAPPGEQAHAARWWTLAVAAGLLRESEESIAFVDDALREYFCLCYCQAHPLDAWLLRLATRESFSAVWRRWAGQDPTLAERLMALLLGNRRSQGMMYAAVALRYLDDPQIVDRLIAALGNTSVGVRVRAALALGALADPRAIEPLVAQLEREPHVVSVPMIEALGRFGEPALPALIRLLHHPDWVLGRASGKALGSTGSPQAAELLIPFLGGARMSSDSYTDQAIEGLGRLGKVAVPALIVALKDDRSGVRRHAAILLGDTHDARAAQPLLDALKREAASVPQGRVSALQYPSISSNCLWIGDALVTLRNPQALDLLIDALKEQHEVVRAYVVRALGEMQDERAVEPLLAMIDDDAPVVRWEAADALGKFRDAHQKTIESWIKLLSDSNAQVRLQTARALGNLGNTQAVEPLIQALSDQDRRVRERVIEALGVLRDRRAVGPLVSALADPEKDVRAAAARALGRLGDRQALEALIQALSDHEGQVRQDAADALGKLGVADAVEPLIQALADGMLQVRFKAAFALSKLGNRLAVDLLLEMLKAQGLNTPEEAIWVLGKLGSKRAVEPLLSLLNGELTGSLRPLHVQRAAMFTLGELGDPRAVEPLIGLIKAGHPDNCHTAAHALARMGTRQALEALQQVQQDASLTRAAAVAVREAIAQLRKRFKEG